MDVSLIPSRLGTYILWLTLDRRTEIEVGRLGKFRFSSGVLAYVGSARGPGGLRARLARHLRVPRPLVWHIDALQTATRPIGIWFAEGKDKKECAWATALASLPGASFPALKFGASDCRCPAHLLHFPTLPDRADFVQATGEAVQEVLCNTLY
ncbi:MAG: GIY-YIG nuclease family protein [Anaerolineae bacterium]|nr:GIY-YIG nuclease family protein [Anaerolineae bacterium]MCX8067914.1 GIY-YIG nuclease family protein [Anaerolineae bacterium]